ncbi:calmodulin [Streptomyces sp. NPDC057838]|uniref:BP74-related protein n=1 Tax=unclassified Streptomyces TaxID=2593676 RepID=UPI0036AEAC7B
MATAYFAFQQRPDQEFIFELNDEERIAHARRILSGEERERVHVMGRIIKRQAPYNPRWSFHLDPDTIHFFDYAIEVCDANVQEVEDHLPEACGAFLPGCDWCPWDSKVVREVQPLAS